MTCIHTYIYKEDRCSQKGSGTLPPDIVDYDDDMDRGRWSPLADPNDDTDFGHGGGASTAQGPLDLIAHCYPGARRSFINE
jgi:hypothetical protein